MGKITAIIDDQLETWLRKYIKKTFVKTHGKIKHVVEEALKLYLAQEDTK